MTFLEDDNLLIHELITAFPPRYGYDFSYVPRYSSVVATIPFSSYFTVTAASYIFLGRPVFATSSCVHAALKVGSSRRE